MKLLNERPVAAHWEIANQIAKQLARMIRKIALTESQAL